MLLQECTFTNVTAFRPLLSVGKATFYSDDDTLAIGNNLGGPISPPDETFPTPLSDPKVAATFLADDDAQFSATKAVRLLKPVVINLSLHAGSI